MDPEGFRMKLAVGRLRIFVKPDAIMEQLESYSEFNDVDNCTVTQLTVGSPTTSDIDDRTGKRRCVSL